jgi:hypothetical protein
MTGNGVRTGRQNRLCNVRIAASEIKGLAGGGGRTRTYEGVSQRIYSRVYPVSAMSLREHGNPSHSRKNPCTPSES